MSYRTAFRKENFGDMFSDIASSTSRARASVEKYEQLIQTARISLRSALATRDWDEVDEALMLIEKAIKSSR